MSETTETLCHWERVQRQWKWEWASYNCHTTGVFWTDHDPRGTTELLDDATLAPREPEARVDMNFSSRWQPVSGTGTNVVVETADLPPDAAPVGDGWRTATPVGG
ncbi:hypothetical protein [Actinotalea subterranea]|uniref:hypothetical protein n=1 Tax=Actinotalea subterranea TaxID=2607497 RepID=UPI00165E677C|nr:hypothetical protein [Actinotalea subterranea]